MALRNRAASLAFIGATIGVFAITAVVRHDSVAARAQRPGTLKRSAEPAPDDVLNQYCVPCHNERRKTAGLIIVPATLYNGSAYAESWEKVVRNLLTASMPPARARRPDRAT